MKKKILSMLLSMVLTVACFTGCGSNPSSGGETGGTASTEIPKNPEDMYTVTMAVIGNDQEDMDLVLYGDGDDGAGSGNRTRIFVSGGRRSIHYTTGTTP